MSDKRQETIADIVAEMRIGDICAADTSASRPEYINDFLASYADRIEVAWKREVETTTDESSAVGNAGTVREIAQEMLNTSMQEITAERINGWATRLAAACEQPVTDCNQLGNTAKMREALEAIKDTLDKWRLNGVEYWQYSELFDIANTVLSAPPRNCDVGTAEEQAERFKTFCYIYPLNCAGCPLKDSGITHNECAIFWTQMPYEEGGARWAKQ